jgi:hypothetical protein
MLHHSHKECLHCSTGHVAVAVAVKVNVRVNAHDRAASRN